MARYVVTSNNVPTKTHLSTSASRTSLPGLISLVSLTLLSPLGWMSGGFVTQAAFLLGNGIEAMTMGIDDVATRARLAGEAGRLLMPGEMGESFKVMALCRDLEVPLRGFARQDLRGSL